MNCPNCKKTSVCFCNSCKKRRKMPSERAERVVKGDNLKCPYCKNVFHIGYLEDLSYQEYLKAKEEEGKDVN